MKISSLGNFFAYWSLLVISLPFAAEATPESIYGADVWKAVGGNVQKAEAHYKAHKKDPSITPEDVNKLEGNAKKLDLLIAKPS